MRLRLSILLSSIIALGCIVDSDCNENIDCTIDICFHGHCNYIPQNDTCYNFLCEVGHCKVMPYMADTCGCFSFIASSSVYQTFDSVHWIISGVTYSTTDRTYCFPGITGVHEVGIYVYVDGAVLSRKYDFYFANCNCTTNSDCDDNSLCTIDRCINNKCENKNAYLNGSPVNFEQWKRDCCHCGM